MFRALLKNTKFEFVLASQHVLVVHVDDLSNMSCLASQLLSRCLRVLFKQLVAFLCNFHQAFTPYVLLAYMKCLFIEILTQIQLRRNSAWFIFIIYRDYVLWVPIYLNYLTLKNASRRYPTESMKDTDKAAVQTILADTFIKDKFLPHNLNHAESTGIYENAIKYCTWILDKKKSSAL